MSYHDLIFQNIDKVYQAGIATKIMQHMARIRNSSDVNKARRWVLELLKNARDVAYPDQPVKIRITCLFAWKIFWRSSIRCLPK